jgi:hypothetical protein
MATTAPTRISKVLPGSAGSEQLIQALRPWRRKLTTQQVLRWAGIGFVTGLILASILLLISRLVPWATALYWAIGVGSTCLLWVLAMALWFRPSLTGTARLVDGRLALHDRVSTAWEFQHETSTLATLQRRDALTQLRKHTPSRSVSLRPHRSYLIILGVVVIAFILLLLLPNPMTAVLQQQAAFQARINKQIASIEHLRNTIDHQTTTSPEERKQIDQILKNLETQLSNAKNESQAQQALAQAQTKLAQLRNPQTTNKILANAAASSSLQNSSNSSLNALGQALAKGDSKGLASALKNLAAQISKLSPAQRAQLAQQLEQAASQASQDPSLSSALHDLAKAAASGNQSDIAAAMQAVENAASQTASAQANQGSIDQASQGLQQAENTLAAANDGTNQGQGQGQNQGQGQGQQGQGQGQGQQGQGQGQGQGQQGQGQGGQGHGGSGGSNGAGNNKGNGEQVYVPGQVGSGSSSQTNGGNNGVVQPGQSVPFSKVIQEYNAMAHDAIDNSSIPPDLKDLVHGYFDTLEGQH